MKRMIDGEPGMLIHPRCKRLRKAYQGGYHYKRVQVGGDARYRDEPDKDLYSHVADADQYLMLGAGEGKALVKVDRSNQPSRPAYAISDYAIFGDD
jgi:hypothetical protein